VSAVDFTEWAAPDLVFVNLGADSEGNGGHTFRVRPPSVDDSAKVLALAVRGEVNMGIVSGVEIPEPIQEVLDSIEAGDHPALGAAFYEMRDAGISSATIDRAAYYAIFYWARGKRYADALAKLMWSERGAEGEGGASGDAPRKG
jgi:hypothetical protein